MKRLFKFLFRHKCWRNKRVVSVGYLKDGQSGVIFKLGTQCECAKCGSKWDE